MATSFCVAMLGISVVTIALFVNAQCEVISFEELVCQHCRSQDRILQYVAGRNSSLGSPIGPSRGPGPQGPSGEVDETRIREIVREEFKRALPSLFDLDEPLYRSCNEIRSSSPILNGVYHINLEDSGPVEVYCDLTTDGGSWIVFQRRKDGKVNFYRRWDHYVDGFGNKNLEFWLGLELLHKLTKNGTWEMRVDLITFDDVRYYAKYRTFKIGSRSDNYRLHVSGFSGNTSNSIEFEHNRKQFSTYDGDHDTNRRANCARNMYGGWWFNDCTDTRSNLNGLYGRKGSTGASWFNAGRWVYLKYTEMKIRRVM